MPPGVLSPGAELRAITDVLGSAQSGPTGLILEGEAGIGKTALWFEALERARAIGFHVLSAQVGEAETVLAAFVGVIDVLAARGPALIAIDDAQWLDPSSRTVISYGVGRFRGRVGVLTSERSDLDDGVVRQWLRLDHDDEPTRIRLGPLGIDVLHSMITAKRGRSLRARQDAGRPGTLRGARKRAQHDGRRGLQRADRAVER